MATPVKGERGKRFLNVNQKKKLSCTNKHNKGIIQCLLSERKNCLLRELLECLPNTGLSQKPLGVCACIPQGAGSNLLRFLPCAFRIICLKFVFPDCALGTCMLHDKDTGDVSAIHIMQMSQCTSLCCVDKQQCKTGLWSGTFGLCKNHPFKRKE